jgi:hypothetical protein
MQFDREKFKKLVHYVIWEMSGKDGFGATKLYKVLWYAEAKAFVLSGKPIAGATYLREKHGPVPKYAMQVRTELEAEGKIKQRLINRGQYKEWFFTSKVPPDTSFLTLQERKTVDYWIKHIDEEHTAGSISEESHDYAWEIAREGEEIPFYAVLANRLREPDDAELRRAKERAKELGLL